MIREPKAKPALITSQYLVERDIDDPTLIFHSSDSTGDLTGSAAAAVEALPNGTHRSPAGEWHGVPDEDFASVLSEYFLLPDMSRPGRSCDILDERFQRAFEPREDAMSAADRTESSDREPRTSGDGVRRSTGRDRQEWFALLDRWGAAGRPYREIAGWLKDEHGVSNWWAQKLTVEYEQARGQRAAGVRPDGTFSGGASKTVSVPVERLFAAFVDARLRKRWLPDVALRKRSSQPGRVARSDVMDDATRIEASFAATDTGKSQVAVEHQRLPDAQAAKDAKAYWRERLAALKALLEG